jgi:hypothetical protein
VYGLLEETGIRLAVLEGLSVLALMTATQVPSEDVQKVVDGGEAIYRLERLLYEMESDEEISSFALAILNAILAHGVIQTFSELEYYRHFRLGLIHWTFKRAENKTALGRSALRFIATVCSTIPGVAEDLVGAFLHRSRQFVERSDERPDDGDNWTFQVMAESIVTILRSGGSGITANFPQVLDFAMYISERGTFEDANAAKLVLMAAFAESGSALGPHIEPRMVPLLRAMIPPILESPSSDEVVVRSWIRTVACISNVIRAGLVGQMPSIIHLFQISFQSYAYVTHLDRMTLLSIADTLVDRCSSPGEVAMVLAQGGGLLGLVIPEPEVSDLVCKIRGKAERLGFVFTL